MPIRSIKHLMKMTTMNKTMTSKYRQRVEQALDQCLSAHHDRLSQAMRYATLNGGKRLRAQLIYATAEEFGLELVSVDALACAVECLHAYSLVHDDLPAMDDDDLRRGLPSCHRAFDEATAILAGDALQALSFELISNNPHLSASIRLKQIQLLAQSVGAQGMVGGQSLDMSLMGKDISLAQLQEIHQQKTGALIHVCLHLAAVASEKYANYCAELSQIGEKIGLCYQILDDILDATATANTLGKTAGKDAAQGKHTYLGFYSVEQAKALLATEQQACQSALIRLPHQGSYLKRIIDALFHREY